MLFGIIVVHILLVLFSTLPVNAILLRCSADGIDIQNDHFRLWEAHNKFVFSINEIAYKDSNTLGIETSFCYYIGNRKLLKWRVNETLDLSQKQTILDKQIKNTSINTQIDISELVENVRKVKRLQEILVKTEKDLEDTKLSIDLLFARFKRLTGS